MLSAVCWEGVLQLSENEYVILRDKFASNNSFHGIWRENSFLFFYFSPHSSLNMKSDDFIFILKKKKTSKIPPQTNQKTPKQQKSRVN